MQPGLSTAALQEYPVQTCARLMPQGLAQPAHPDEHSWVRGSPAVGAGRRGTAIAGFSDREYAGKSAEVGLGTGLLSFLC